ARYLPIIITVLLLGICSIFLLLYIGWRKKQDKPRNKFRYAWQVLAILWTIIPAGYIGGYLYNLDGSRWGKASLGATFVVDVPASDGYPLETRVYLPGNATVGSDDYHGPYPALYLKDSYDWNGVGWGDTMGKYWSSRGYAVVHQLCRGLEVNPRSWRSNHEWEFAWQDYKDGNDTVNWIAQQDWSNGKVVMDGMSYTGWTQWATASEAPSALVGIMPGWMSANPYEFFYYNGMATLDFTMGWLAMMYGLPDPNGVYDFNGPLISFDDSQGSDVEAWNDLLSHPVQDSYWTNRGMRPNRALDVKVPVYSTTGWWDFFAHGQLKDFEMIFTNGSGLARNHSQLTVGPWGHGLTVLGDFPDDAIARASERTGRENQEGFYEACLNGTNLPESKVTLWLNGAWEWIEAERLPWPGMSYSRFYLHDDGGEKKLNTTAPTASEDETFNSYLYDPLNTEVLTGDVKYGYRDHSFLSARDDHLLFTMDITSNLTLIGSPKVHLFAETNCTDTDWVVEILDIYPDGRQMFLSHGMMRAQARDGMSLVPVSPGSVVEYEIDIMHLANRFVAGHKLGILISSSKYPIFVRNTNTGNVLLSSNSVIANNTIYHSPVAATFIDLPVVT
ncbi:MAG: CocE/NonD family hydrolase, partial [Promethearchaeota archaeon]